MGSLHGPWRFGESRITLEFESSEKPFSVYTSTYWFNKGWKETEDSLATFSQIRPARSTSAIHSPSLKKTQELKSASMPIGARARIMFQLICPFTTSATVP